MKSFDTRAYSINDFIEWKNNGQLELNPRFQRRSVWTDNARSYLMDTILRGKPIPKIFIRQRLDTTTNKSIRDVVDGQQRLRTILSFVNDGFKVNKRHNPKYGGLFFSQLSSIDEDVQSNILHYEVAVDLLINMSDPEVLDIFGRLNSYSVILNEQEKLHAQHFGPFKSLSESIGHQYYDFWLGNNILSEMQVLRMGDTALVSDLLVAMLEGIKSKKQIKIYYSSFEKEFPYDPEAVESEFKSTLQLLSDIFTDQLKYSEYRRIHVFYSLFTALFHANVGLKGLQDPRPKITPDRLSRIRIALERVDEIFVSEDTATLPKVARQFLEDSRRATTDAAVRIRRTQFINSLILGATG